MTGNGSFRTSSRRVFLQSLGVTGVVSIAGCSGENDRNGGTDSETSETTPNQTSTQTQDYSTDEESMPATEGTPTEQEHEDPNQRSIEDTVEERYRDGWGFEWVEFENPQEQLVRPQNVTPSEEGTDYEFINFLVFDGDESNSAERYTRFLADHVDTAYFMVNNGEQISPGQGADENDVVIGAIEVSEGEYQDHSQSEDYFDKGFSEGTYVQREAIERFFEENVEGYTEASEEFPEEFLSQL